MMTDEISSSNASNFVENNFQSTREPTGNAGEDEENWFYERQRTEENSENNLTEPNDDVNEQENESRADPPISSGLSMDPLDDDSDDEDEIEVTIGNIQTAPTLFPNRQLSRQTNPPPPTMPMKNQPHRGVDLDAQGTINGQPTYEHDLTTAYKDDEKPWKKPGADITDYFNYGFTEETWAAYCDRQRRLRSENNTARLNVTQIPPMAPMIPGPIPIMHPMNPLPVVTMHKPPMNVQMIPQRPYMNPRKPDGKIDVIGGTDLTSRRAMYDMQNNFDHPSFLNGPQFPAGQPPNGQTVGDVISTPPASNGPPTPHGTPTGANHAIPTLGGHRMPMIHPPGMQFRPAFGHPHVPGGPGFFSHGPGGPMHGERPPGPYFMPPHPQQAWEKPGVPPGHGFPPGHFPPPPNAAPGNTGNGRTGPSSRSSTPEDQSSRSSTPEENRPGTSNIGGENVKTSKDDRYKERYRDDRDRQLSTHRRSSPGKDRSSSSYRSSRHRSGDHEYERPRSDRKSSRDRDDKYERYSRKRHHRDESSRHHRSGADGPDDESSRSHRSRRTPTKNFSSPPKTNSYDPTQSSIDNVEGIDNNGSSSTPTISGTASGSPSGSRSRREGSSSRHGHHKKSSKRSRRDDSGDERSHHRRRSKDKSSSSKKSSSSSSNINAVDSSTIDGKDQQQQQQQQQLSND